MSTDEFSKYNAQSMSNYSVNTSNMGRDSSNSKQPRVSVLCEDIDDSSDDSSSTSGDEIILDNYSTKRFVQTTANSSDISNDFFTPKKSKSNLGIIFERSDESVTSSQSTLLQDDTSSQRSLTPIISPTNHITDNNNNEITYSYLSGQLINTNKVIDIDLNYNNTISSSMDPSFDIDDSLLIFTNNNDMRNDIATDTHIIDSSSELRDAYTQPSVFNWSSINNKPLPLLSQSELIFNKRTPRFHIKNNSNNITECERVSLNNHSYQIENDYENMQKTFPAKKPDIPKKPTREQLKKNVEKEIVTDLDDLATNYEKPTNIYANDLSKRAPSDVLNSNDVPEQSGSYFKNQMLKSYSKNDLKVNHRYDKRGDTKKVDPDNGSLAFYDKNSPNRRSQEITGSIMKMDKTIDCVNNNIAKIDNALGKMKTIKSDFMSNLEKESDAELTSDFETQSIGAQTDSAGFVGQDSKIKRPLNIRKQSYSSDDSSTGLDTDSDDSDSRSLKPSPVHQMITSKPLTKIMSPVNDPKVTSKTVANLKTQMRHDSDLSSLPDSSICEEPEKRELPAKVLYFQRQAKKNAGLYKKPANIEPPKKLVVQDERETKPKPVMPPIPKPRNSIDGGSAKGTLDRHLSTSSSESSLTHEYQRTLSNSNNHNRNSISPGNSESGSFISSNSTSNFGKRYQKGGTSGRYAPKTSVGDKYGTAMKLRNPDEDEAASLSGRYDARRSPMKRMTQSRSYNSLNAINSRMDNDTLRSGSLAALNNNETLQGLCEIVQQYLNLNKYDQIKSIFISLKQDNDPDQIEYIIDNFQGRDRKILMEIADRIGYRLKETESIFDLPMSRSDLHNNLRPGLSVSTLNESNYYQHSNGVDMMVLWRADIEELFPPPMKPAPKPMPTNLLKSAIISPESMQHVDNNVLEALQFEPTTFTELVTYLTRDCSKDVEKVRALFRWITMYDIKAYNFDPAAPNETLIGVLRSVKNGQMSLNELFYQMCRYAGIHCQFICGYSKGAGYKPGMSIKDNRMFRNVWTAVYVAGAWRFVNCNWGARYLSSHHHEQMLYGTLPSNANNNLESIENKYRCDEFYFLTDPKQHIFEHFPDKKRWQLLNRPLTLDQFMTLPIVKSPFFNANLSFKRDYRETLQTKNGKITIKINMPKAVGISCRLENSADNTVLRGLTLVRVLDNQMIMVTAAPSQPGKFYLSIYVSEDWISEEGREMACSFQVHCAEHNYDRLVTGRFPEVGVLGATPAAQNLGVVINPTVDPFVIWDERSAMKLNLIISPGLRISHKMMSYHRSGQNSSPCDSYAMLQCLGQGRSQYHLRFPVDGFYCLTIFAGVCDAHMPETEPMECIYRILVDCRHAQEEIPPFPRHTSRWVGFRLMEPLCQQLELNKSYRFKIWSTVCSSMAVVINNNDWHDLTVSGDGTWKGKINTGQELDTLSVYGKFGVESEEDEEFTKLLDYALIPNLKRK